ncbi:hypothetical protein FJR38_02840 [Anabaena sp. UHCC 0253]|uniref:hypothetical protein n=1 Tax=Anabaena sp. UHCC 0253 TaxID=2590019 RepID=UPI001446732F|nr:hypothetical protein [Anabaena sp. UHCC 0253]MTJ51692.1 hypothetical protein [Anabaena sp. UHCC 0253]
MSDFSEQQKQLKIQKGIRQKEDHLVIWIQNALNQTIYEGLEESQFRNLVRVADTTDSVEVIKNFLLYQVGRGKKWGRGENSLANRIINDFNDNIKPLARDIQNKSDADELNPIWIELIRRYLGYGARYLVYRNEVEN